MDIALIELTEGSTSFDLFMPVHTCPLNLGDGLNVISCRAIDTPEEFAEYLQQSAVTVVLRYTALFHST